MTQKSRDISLVDLYSNLQLEYISYFVRSKIYCKDHTENYKKVCKQKFEKIDIISRKNNLISIFNDVETKLKYINKFLNATGEPNFTYKDDEIRQKMSKWDNFYFFNKGTSVKFVINGEVKLGVITYNNKVDKILTVKDESSKYELHYSCVTRLFSEDYFNFNL